MPRYGYVEWDGEALRVALYSVRRRATVEFCAEEQLRRDADWEAEAIRLLHSAGAERVAGLNFVLGRPLFTLRELWLPDAPDTELPGIVRFQAARELGVPVEKAHLDYTVLTRRSQDGVAQVLVLVASLDDQVVQQCATIAKALECPVSAILPRPMVVAQGAATALGSVFSDQIGAVLYNSGALLELAVGTRGQLILVRSVRLVGEQETELQEELLRTGLMAEHHPAGGRIEIVAIPGPSPLSERWQRVAEKLGLKSLLYDPFGPLNLSGGDELLPAEKRAEWAPLASVIASPGVSWPINIASPKMPVVESRLPSTRVMALLGTAAVLLVGLGLWAAWTVRQLDSRIEERRSHQQRLDRFLQAAAPLLKKHQAVETWLGNGQSRVTWLHVLAELSQLFPGTDRVYVDSMSMRRAENGQLRIVVEGYARSLDDVAQFHVAINSGKRFRARPRGGVQRVPRRQDYQWRFESELTLVEGSAGTASTDSTTAGVSRRVPTNGGQRGGRPQGA